MTVPLPSDGPSPPAGRHLPPVAETLVGSMALVIVAGVYLAAHLPTRPPLGPAGVLLVAAAGAVARLRPFAWGVFYRVAGWALLAYIVIAGMLEYIFVLDQARGWTLVVLTASLPVFAVDVPLLFAFSVARYQQPEP